MASETDRDATTNGGWLGYRRNLDGEPDWTLESLQLKIEKEFGVSFGLEGVRRLLFRYGLRYTTPRPHHRKADFE